MRNKESWFSVAIHPAFLIEDELEKGRKKKNAPDASLQLGFPDLGSKAPESEVTAESVAPASVAPASVAPVSVAPVSTSPDTIDLSNRVRIDALKQPQIDPVVPAEVPAHTRTERTFGRISDSSKPQIDPQIDPVASAEVPAHRRTERTFGRVKLDKVSDEPEIHPNDKIWPTDDSPSLVDRIRGGVSTAGGHLKNLADRISRVFGSSPETGKGTSSSISPSIEPSRKERIAQLISLRGNSPERMDELKTLRGNSPERLDELRTLRESRTGRSPGQETSTTLPNAQTLTQNLLTRPVGQVGAETEPVGPSSSEQETTDPEMARTSLTEIRTLRDANAHREKLDALYNDADAAHEANPSEETFNALRKARDESIAADNHFYGHREFENADETDLLHGDRTVFDLRGKKSWEPHEWPDYRIDQLGWMANAMRQKIEDAGGIHKAMQDPDLARKINLVHQGEEHLREQFPLSYDAMQSDEHEGDVAERPLEGIRNIHDAYDHSQKITGRYMEEQEKFFELPDGSEEKKARGLTLAKIGEAVSRAQAHYNALQDYRDNSPEEFSAQLDQLDPENMSDKDRETYRIHMNAANTVLQQKIKAAGGKDYAQYNPRIKAFQDRIRQVAAAHRAANPQAWEQVRQANAATRSATTSPNAPTLAQNLLTQPVGQVERQPTITNPDITKKLRLKRFMDTPLSGIRNVRDAEKHYKALQEFRDNVLFGKDYFSEPDDVFINQLNDKRIEARSHFEGHEDFENAETTPLLHGDSPVKSLERQRGLTPEEKKREWESVYGTHAHRVVGMGNAMRQRIEDAGGIHNAMKDPDLAKKIPLVLEAEEHMREQFPERYLATESDDHKGDVLDRPLEGIRSVGDARKHMDKISIRKSEEKEKLDNMPDGTEEKTTQGLKFTKAQGAIERAFAHMTALHTYRDNELDDFFQVFDQMDKNQDKEMYTIYIDAANTVLQQKIRAAGGEDYAQYNPRIMDLQDRIRKIENRPAQNGQAQNGQAPNGPTPNGPTPNGQSPNRPAPNGPAQNLQNALAERASAAQRAAQERREAEEKRKEEIAKEQEKQKNLRLATENLGVKYGSPKRRR